MTDETTVVVDENNFKQFIKCLNVIKESCNDIDIVGGKVRQRSNDKAAIFEVDFSNILGNVNMPLIGLKTKSKLIEYFTDEVTICLNNESITFSDRYSSIRFEKPDPSYIDNQFLEEEFFHASFPDDPGNLILDHIIPKIIVDRIKITILNFNIYRVDVKFKNNNKADFSIGSNSNDQSAKFLNDILLDAPISESTTSIYPVAFLADSDEDIHLQIFTMSDNDKIFQKSEITVEDTNINIYTYSKLKFLNTGN